MYQDGLGGGGQFFGASGVTAEAEAEAEKGGELEREGGREAERERAESVGGPLSSLVFSTDSASASVAAVAAGSADSAARAAAEGAAIIEAGHATAGAELSQPSTD